MKRILCVGDSLTYGDTVERAEAWPAVAARLGELSGQGDLEFVNRGTNGAVTADMLARLPAWLEKYRPEAVILMGGANDLIFLADARAPLANMETMARLAGQSGARAFIGIPVPICPPVREDWAAVADFAAVRAWYDEYAERLRELCARQGFAALDFRAGFTAAVARSGRNARTFYSDGLHPNAGGHRILADIVLAALGELQ